MSIATEITRLQTAKSDIKSSIEAKGVTVPSSALIDDYADYIDNIEQGGSAPTIDSKEIAEPLYFLASPTDCAVGICKNGSPAAKTFYYSFDKENWTAYTPTTTVNNIPVAKGKKIYWKGSGNFCSSSNSKYYYFTKTSNAYLYAGGNVMSLLGDNWATNVTIPENYCFTYLFKNMTYLKTPPVFPATNLTQACYYYIFSGCADLGAGPILPATTVSTGAYQYMFYNCLRLANAPVLPATSLGTYCYAHMFDNCIALATCPELPAKTMSTGCYQYMFYNCTSLVNPPKLGNTTLTERCYRGMFAGCTSLLTIPELPATTLQYLCYESMFKNCTSLQNIPNIAATTLAQECCSGMFEGCTALVTGPDLHALTLQSGCYTRMFYGCTSLKYIKAMFTTTPTTSYTNQWVYNVPSGGTFVKNSAATWSETGVYAVPSGWTIITESN